MIKNTEDTPQKAQKPRKMTKKRLENIGLYYLERFDSSADNLRKVLKRRVFDYARKVPDFETREAEEWIDEIVEKFEKLGYLNDCRYAEYKIDDYLAAGKPERYIRQKMALKGVADNVVDNILQNRDFDEEKMAMQAAMKKKIGPWRKDENDRKNNRQKDLACLIRAGFNYDIAQKIINLENPDDFA